MATPFIQSTTNEAAELMLANLTQALDGINAVMSAKELRGTDYEKLYSARRKIEVLQFRMREYMPKATA